MTLIGVKAGSQYDVGIFFALRCISSFRCVALATFAEWSRCN